MLINLSNHPVANWEFSQIKEAESSFMSIRDLNFPHIPPEADTEYIADLAGEYFTKCMNLLNKRNNELNAVHIMGEMTFSFALINMLIKENVLCLASTTKRDTSMIDNTKISKFKFVKFRKYSY